MGSKSTFTRFGAMGTTHSAPPGLRTLRRKSARRRASSFNDSRELSQVQFSQHIHLVSVRGFSTCSLLTSFRAAEDRDHRLAAFISSLRPQTLRYFQTFRDVGASVETFLALSSHNESLKDLRLCLSNESLEHLSLLRECTSLETLRLEDTSGSTDLEKTQHDVFLEVIQWLRNCKNLRDLTMTRFLSAAALVTPVLLEDSIQLRRLELDSYVAKDHQLFHEALGHQASSLRVLSLSGETDEMFRDDLDILENALGSLTRLKELKLLLPEVLSEGLYQSILAHLKDLQELYITGLVLTDAVLPSVANLSNLRSVTFNGISCFTKDGLLSFVSQLGPGNSGLRIMIDMADPDQRLSDEDVALVRSVVESRVDGIFEYTLFRGRRAPLCSRPKQAHSSCWRLVIASLL